MLVEIFFSASAIKRAIVLQIIKESFNRFWRRENKAEGRRERGEDSRLKVCNLEREGGRVGGGKKGAETPFRGVTQRARVRVCEGCFFLALGSNLI